MGSRGTKVSSSWKPCSVVRHQPRIRARTAVIAGNVPEPPARCKNYVGVGGAGPRGQGRKKKAIASSR
jgi:hypothetical protein